MTSFPLIATLYLAIIIINVLLHLNSFSIMKKCWALNPEDRPGFEKLSSTLGKLIETAAGYLELSMVLLPLEESGVESKR